MKKAKFKLSLGKSIILGLLAIVLIVVAILVVRWLLLFQLNYDYKKDLTSYGYEDGTTFKPIDEAKSDVTDEGFVLGAQNDTLKVYVNPTNGYVAIYDKRNNTITYSNPLKADEDEVATGINKSFMKSQIIVDYFGSNRLQGTMNSFDDCVAHEQLEIQSIKDGFRFVYTIGSIETKLGIVPLYMSQETFDKLLTKMKDSDAAQFKTKYKPEPGLKEGYLKLIPGVAEKHQGLQTIQTQLAEAGFTKADYIVEMSNSGMDDAVPLTFTVPLEYRLQDDAVTVSVPLNKVTENGGGYIYRMQINRYFGCAGPEEEGYILVPNGCGGIINFNNNKLTAANYSEFVYGIDPLTAEYSQIENAITSKMALYGIFRKNTAVFTTIEDGATFTTLTAGISGKITSYNAVYPTFVLRGSDTLQMFGATGSEAALPIIEDKFYDANLEIRYTMLYGEDVSYSGAANYYRERLIKEGKLTPDGDATVVSKDDIKFYYDVLGATSMVKFFLGTQYNGTYAMTTFDQAINISNDLASKGIKNQVMNFQGWMNGGFSHDAVNRVKLVNQLGNRKKFEKLSKTLAENGGTFYADAALQQVTSISKHYEESNETSRYYASGYNCELGLVNPTTLRKTAGLGYDENRYYLLSPRYLGRYIDIYVDKTKGMNFSGYSFRDLGDVIHSDKRKSCVVNREEALDIIRAGFEDFKSTGKNVMVSSANDYAWQYADDIINVPMNTNEYLIIDEEVPFYQMVIHGCVDYSGLLVNMTEKADNRDVVLELIEKGASPHFVFSEKNSSDIKNTGLNRYYATTYSSWSEEAVDVYTQVNEALKYVNDAYMIDYVNLSKDVKKIAYSNGVTIYVNYGTTAATVDGVNVPAKSYQLGGVQ